MYRKSNKFSPKVRERAVRMVLKHRGDLTSCVKSLIAIRWDGLQMSRADWCKTTPTADPSDTKSFTRCLQGSFNWLSLL